MITTFVRRLAASTLLCLALAGSFHPAAAQVPIANTPANPNGEGNPKADPAAYALLKAAHDARQVLPPGFVGFTASLSFFENGKSFSGTLVHRSQGKTEITIPGLSTEQKEWVDDKLLSFIGHRRGGDFAKGDGKNPLTFGKEPENHFGKLIELNDRMQSNYRVKDNKVTEVTRVAGDTRFTISVMETMTADPGKYLANHFTVAYRDAKTNALQEVEGYRDSYAQFDKVWLPVGRAVYAFGSEITPTVRYIKLTGHQLLTETP